MTDTYHDNLILLRDKVRKIMELYEKEKDRNEKLIVENQNISGKLKSAEESLNNIKIKYDKLKIAKGMIASSNDMHDAKLKVNRMVREIDKCIALLNR